VVSPVRWGARERVAIAVKVRRGFMDLE